jgi:hypothetical protein
MPLKVKKVTIPTIAASVLFNGSNQYLSVASNAAFGFGASDYTIEFWTYYPPISNTNGKMVIDSRPTATNGNYWIFGTSNNGILSFYPGPGGTTITDTVARTNQWVHYAVSRLGSSLKLFANGTQVASTTDSSTTLASGLLIGANAFRDIASDTYWSGYISNVRILKGTALYTSNFTPSTATLPVVTNTSLLTCHDTSIYDASTNNFTVTNNNTATVSTVSPFPVLRSVSFNGSNQYLSIANNAAFNFGTGSFTIEWWQYLNSAFAGSNAIPIGQKTSDGTNGWQIYRNTTVNTDKISVRITGTTDYPTTVTPSSQVWEHWALVRDNSSTLTWYRNGTACGTYSNVTSNISDSGNMNIGYAQTWGYAAASSSISNLRILKGTAVYTSSFTASTSPLTAITSCSLLTCNDQTIRDASVNNFTVTNNNTATVSTVSPFIAASPSSMKFKKTSTGRIGRSVYFTGASQYLYTPTSTSFDPSTSTPWTLEYWGYPINGCIVTLATGAAYGNSLWVSWGSSQFTWIQGNSAGSNPVLLTTAASYPANNWYHIVVCKDAGNTSRMFINGTQVLSSAYNGGLGSPNRLVVNNAWDNNGFYGGGNGYVSNVRWIKGTALYTASFTVPTAPLTAITNTALLTCNLPTIVDSSTNNFAITNVNAATVSTTNPFGADTVSGTFKVKKSAGVYMVATGGDLITTSGSYKIHTFTTVGTSSFTISSVGSTPSIEYLIVGGGGAGGSNNNCGGGGAGGLIYNTASLSAGAYAVTIGQSGSVASGVSNGNNGGNSTFNGLIALGGGGGGGSTAGSNGGSGGGNGGGGFSGTDSGGGAGLQPTSSYGGFGNKGGFSAGASSYPGGGGGGAGAAGNNGSGATGGNGGIGKAYAFAGALTYYAGGGGGSLNPGTAGTGGLGGGGNGRSTIGVGIAATGYGSGGGGGLSAGSGGEGGAGSPGIILIKYRYTD